MTYHMILQNKIERFFQNAVAINVTAFCYVIFHTPYSYVDFFSSLFLTKIKTDSNFIKIIYIVIFFDVRLGADGNDTCSLIEEWNVSLLIGHYAILLVF